MIRAALLAAGLIAAWAALANAQPAPDQQCGPLDKALEDLSQRYHETIKWTGKDARGNRLVLTTSPQGTWTLLVTVPQKTEGAPIACMVGSDGAGGDGA